MNFYKYLLLVISVNCLHADNQSTEDILRKAFHRIDGIDHSFKIKSTNNGKKQKQRQFKISVHWLSIGEIDRKVYVESINSKDKKPPSFWEHRHSKDVNTKKWMTMPITGKLKDVSHKKTGKKNFSFSELEFSEEYISSNQHNLLLKEKIGVFSSYVIETIEENSNGKIKQSKKIWIDTETYVIHKIELYTASDRLYRSIECYDYKFFNKVYFPMLIQIKDFKSKTDIQIDVTDIELYPEFDMDIFIPKDQ